MNSHPPASTTSSSSRLTNPQIGSAQPATAVGVKYGLISRL
jgi:hypothetical protein